VTKCSSPQSSIFKQSFKMSFLVPIWKTKTQGKQSMQHLLHQPTSFVLSFFISNSYRLRVALLPKRKRQKVLIDFESNVFFPFLSNPNCWNLLFILALFTQRLSHNLLSSTNSKSEMELNEKEKQLFVTKKMKMGTK